MVSVTYFRPNAALGPTSSCKHPHVEEDLRLMQRAGAGDQTAQREVAVRLVGRARRVSLALLRNEADADDAAQLALLEVLRSAGSFRGEAPLEKWADRIVARTALRLARDARARRGTIDGEADPDDTTQRSEDAGTTIDVQRYLERLPEARREVVVLRHMMGYSVEEVASMTGVSPNTVKDRLVQALQQVRAMVRKGDA